MWQAAGNAARSVARFARRHRRAVIIGGVVGAAACVYHSVKKAVKEAEEEHTAMLLQAGDDARRRQCLSRTRGECVAALGNFLPALKKRLFHAVDVTGPVRQLKALRTGAGTATAAGGGAAGGDASGRSAGNAESNGSSAAGGGNSADGSGEVAEDLQSREVALWEQVKVTALTRLVVSLYAFSGLALMLHMQLHILGRLSFEESQELLRRANREHDEREDDEDDCDDRVGDINSTNASLYSSTGRAKEGGRCSPWDEGSRVGGGGGGKAGLALSMQARHALLSSTYEHVLGDGLRALVRDVERAVSRCTCSWRAHTRQEVEFQELVGVIRRVRREIEGPVGGIEYHGGVDVHSGGRGDSGGGGGGGGCEGLGRPSGVRHALLLRYFINPSDGIGASGGSEKIKSAGVLAAAAQTAPANGARSEGAAAAADLPRWNGSRASDGISESGAAEYLEGVGEVLDETWDMAESPNFAAALQSCLDMTFGIVYEQLRQKAFCRGSPLARQVQQQARKQQQQQQQQQKEPMADGVAVPVSARPVAAVVDSDAGEGGDGAGGRRPAGFPSGPVENAAAGPRAANGDGGGQLLTTAEDRSAVGRECGKRGLLDPAPAVAETEESAQVLATVISQAKVVVSDILDPSPQTNEYAHAVASLSTVQDLCFSVFGGPHGGGSGLASVTAVPAV